MKLIAQIFATLLFLLSGASHGEMPGIEDDKLILGFGNIVEIGMEVDDAIKYLEGNNYKCDELDEKPDQFVYCRTIQELGLSDAESYEIELIVESSKVKEFNIRNVDLKHQ